MPDTPGFSDDVINKLGQAIDRYFKSLYPVPRTLPERLRALSKHYGSQDKAGRAIGISARTIRRWLTGRAIPIKRTLARAESAYLSVHLKINGHRPANGFERRTAEAWSAGAGIRQLGELAEKIMARENKVPVILSLPNVPTFEPGMVRMWAAGCSVSDDDARDNFPFNTGLYAQ